MCAWVFLTQHIELDAKRKKHFALLHCDSDSDDSAAITECCFNLIVVKSSILSS